MMKTEFDDEIEKLEKAQAEDKAALERLEAGWIKHKFTGGSDLELNLSGLLAGGNADEIRSRVREMVAANNPLLPVVAAAFKKEDEMRQFLLATGEMQVMPDGQVLPRLGVAASATGQTQAGGKLRKLLAANVRFNLRFSRKYPSAGKYASSPWLIVAGLVILFFWGGGSVLYSLTGGAIGADDDYRPRTVRRPTVTTTTTPTTPAVTPAWVVTTAPAAANTTNVVTVAPGEPTADPGQPIKADYRPALNQAPKPVATNAAAATYTEAEGEQQQQQIPEVSPAGGNNRPHGAFVAPSSLSVTALGLTRVPVVRALTWEQAGKLSLIWPQPGEVAHFGAYPGELGNTVLLANQVNLGQLRRLQLNDAISLTDRAGNVFTYTVIPFSPAGQPERMIDPTLDGWIYEPVEGAAILTVVLNMPQPASAALTVTTSTTNASATGTQPPALMDDYLNPNKLAYRAVLSYAPKTTATPSGVPVVVPDTVYQVRPAAQLHEEVLTVPGGRAATTLKEAGNYWQPVPPEAQVRPRRIVGKRF